MDKNSYLNYANSGYIDELYKTYLEDPENTDFGWRKFFEGFEFARGSKASEVTNETPEHFLKELNVLNMISGYRTRGHLFTKTNPVRERRKYFPGKELSTFGLSDQDLETVFQAGVEVGIGPAKLKDILGLLEQTYCQSIGVEYKFIRNPIKTKWFEDRMEKNRNTPNFSVDIKKRILEKLNEAVVFESFLGTKFLGQKRFSLEGAESVIPAIDAIIEHGSELGIQEFVIGMAHRGRLNVLANIMGKSYKEIFNEFEGTIEDDEFGGDVKYHMGYYSKVKTNNGANIELNLCPNPSHLEAVDPVVEGITRAKMDQKYKGDYKKIAPILIHGDASVSGQGIVYEVLQMSKLDGYKTGGTIHLVINNQVGFTTNFKDGRSSTYCTDLGKTTLSPIFHVNGDDVEALVLAINLAVEYRQAFHNDVFIDVLCYRRYGHNESDEPRFTQPTLYKAIEKHPNPREIYVKQLLDTGFIDVNVAKEMEKNFRALLQEKLNESKLETSVKRTTHVENEWKDIRFAKSDDFISSPITAVKEKELIALGKSISSLPKDKAFFKKIQKLFEERMKMFTDTKVIDWAMGEQLAYATLIQEGHPVRISGQDVERGTFSHRHAVVKLEDSEEEYIPLANISKSQVAFNIFNSHLSEYGVLGFEYGYALVSPNDMVIWEAQFGDFINGAQIIIDQFLSSAETKWRKMNNLIMFLPHGYEGQGPEHSSARIERFLEACADNNMQLVNCTTPANFFHVLRRQLKRDFRKPLVVFTPKSLLRHPLCVSPLKDLAEGGFKEVITDLDAIPNKVERILFCSGKVYYDLKEYQTKNKRTDVAIVRLEQLYPLPYKQLEEILGSFPNTKKLFWVQEEPRNMGAWPYLCRKFNKFKIDVISRKESSSTATGYHKQHLSQQQYIVEAAFAKEDVQKEITNNKPKTKSKTKV